MSHELGLCRTIAIVASVRQQKTERKGMRIVEKRGVQSEWNYPEEYTASASGWQYYF
jgi:hypothetical protein